MTNAQIATHMLKYARSIAGTHLYRSRSYRRAAFDIQGLDRPVEELLRERGRPGLSELPGIGRHLAFTIETLVTTGEFVPYSERNRRRVSALDRVA